MIVLLKEAKRLEQSIQQLQKALKEANHIAFFSGAGMSTDSGIPDFRSADGIYNEQLNTTYRSEEIISHSFFIQHPAIFFEFYFDKMVYPEAEPNAGHEFLAELEKRGKRVSVVTQNIDGLHQKAGSKEVYELHGSVERNYCMECGTEYDLSELQLDDQGIPRCPKDQGIVRPDVVLYEEGLDQDTIAGAVEAIQAADLLIVAGTSLVVYPAAGLVRYFRGNQIAVINTSPIQVAGEHVIKIQDRINNAFDIIDIEAVV